ncbi:hypothetical protein V5799_007027 [Amblyomma americanum]|uniref:Uncharacterized protein n=1 Tax=Amblyomma americanum TaxID=6943 RepID=A0AAQ4DUQ7_AMBAM
MPTIHPVVSMPIRLIVSESTPTGLNCQSLDGGRADILDEAPFRDKIAFADMCRNFNHAIKLPAQGSSQHKAQGNELNSSSSCNK